jgi:Zn-dependent protease
MNGPFNLILYEISIWAIPALVAITFHEASHGYVAHLLGDDTAWRLGRVSFNPLVHIDPFGTVVLPVILLLLRAPFLFGYAKPVPVNFRALRRPRLDTILVAAAGPGMNLLLATIAALAFHIVGYIPAPGAQWFAANLKNALLLNVVLTIFNLLPIPPLDGGRILVGILPGALAHLLSRAEPYGLLMLIGLLFVLPMLGLDPISRLIMTSTNAVVSIILRLTGNG